MKSFKILAVAALVLAATGVANAGSSFAFTGKVEGASSILELGKKAENTDNDGATAPQAVSIQDPAPGEKASNPEMQKEMVQNGNDEDNAREATIPAEIDDSTIDRTVTASATEPKPFFEAAPFSPSELRH
jgi:hypothetical protein